MEEKEGRAHICGDPNEAYDNLCWERAYVAAQKIQKERKARDAKEGRMADAKVTVEEMATAIESAAMTECNQHEPAAICDAQRLFDAAAYIRHADVVLGQIANIVSFKPASKNDSGEHCGCVDAIRETLKNLAGGTKS